jgi:lysyl-tRNA synthetase class 2
LSRASITDVHLASVQAGVCGERFFLHTSPEYAMKRLLAAGYGDLWQVARVYRDGESGRWHSPEFTMVEWYRLGLDHHGLMDEVERLAASLLRDLRSLDKPERIAYRDVVEQRAGLDPFTATGAAIATRLHEKGVDVPAGLETDRDACLDLVMSTVVGPGLGTNRLTFVYDYPASQAALARVRGLVASRFELYLDGVELANGFHELSDPSEQRARFERDRARRVEKGLDSASEDERFLAALAAGLPDCAGVALGFDRLVMCALGLSHIEAVQAFPFGEG